MKGVIEMTTITSRAHPVMAGARRRSSRPAVRVPTSLPLRWTSLRRWFAQIQWDEVDGARGREASAVRFEAERRRLFASLH